MSGVDAIFAVLAAGTLLFALRAFVRMLGAAWGLDQGEGEGR